MRYVGCHCEYPSPRNTYILSQCLTHYQTSRWHLKRLNFDFNLYLEYWDLVISNTSPRVKGHQNQK